MDVLLPKGFYMGGYAAGLKLWKKEDIGLIYSDSPASAAGIFTVNKFQAAPVKLCKKQIQNEISAVLANSGGANACTGPAGYENALQTIRFAAEKLRVDPAQVLPASTGVIGKQLDVEKFQSALQNIEIGCKPAHIEAFARSIMTTDTFPKIVSRQVHLNEGTVTITAVSKGAGMIAPNMATMLAFIVTDVKIERSVLQEMLKKAADSSYHCITIDGDMSTNDSVICLANGQSVSVAGKEDIFFQNLEDVMQESARLIVKDGEGATKFITIQVGGAPSKEAARGVAEKVANSNLVKTAFFGEDANWGRIVSAAGSYDGEFQPEKMQVFIGSFLLFENLIPCRFSEEAVSQYLRLPEITVNIELNQGKESAVVWTCDFSYDYVKINAHYRT